MQPHLLWEQGAAVAAGAAGGAAAGVLGMRALGNRRRGVYDDDSSDEDASEDVVVPKVCWGVWVGVCTPVFLCLWCQYSAA